MAQCLGMIRGLHWHRLSNFSSYELLKKTCIARIGVWFWSGDLVLTFSLKNPPPLPPPPPPALPRPARIAGIWSKTNKRNNERNKSPGENKNGRTNKRAKQDGRTKQTKTKNAPHLKPRFGFHGFSSLRVRPFLLFSLVFLF